MASFHIFPITSDLRYFRAMLALFLPEVPGNFLVPALSPMQFSVVFFFFLLGVARMLGEHEEKKWSVDLIALNTSISQYHTLFGPPVRCGPYFLVVWNWVGKEDPYSRDLTILPLE